MKIKLPESGQNLKSISKEIEKSLVIIGSNGSGKTRLGLWIKSNQDGANIFRIAALRDISFPDWVSIDPVTEVESRLFSTQSKKNKTKKNIESYDTSDINNPESDFSDLVNLLLGYENTRNREYIKKVKTGAVNEAVEESPLDLLIKIWNKVIPNITLELRDSNISAIKENVSYSATQMSDGEKLIFYMLAKCICLPKNSILLIDEPETHINLAINNYLWDEIENLRHDCCFIYMTHDLNFAVRRFNSNILWLKSFNNDIWDYEEIEDKENIDKQVYLEILGSSVPYLFIEGQDSSSDFKIYSKIYQGFKVIPRRSEEKIRDLQAHNIYTLDCAEVENLFCLPKIIEYACKIQKLNYSEVFPKIKEKVIKKFETEKENQAFFKVKSSTKEQLSNLNFKGGNIDEFNKDAAYRFSTFSIKDSYEKNLLEFQNYIEADDYISIIKVFNYKGLVSLVSQVLEFEKEGYKKLIYRLLGGDDSIIVSNFLLEYLPNFR